VSDPIAVVAVMFLVGYTAAGVYYWLRDRGWRRATRRKDEETWRQVPPPNWASRRGTQDYW
jgi:hypothetical protein